MLLFYQNLYTQLMLLASDVFLKIPHLFHQTTEALDPDVSLSPVNYIHRKGFRSQTHTVTTQDGYILAVYRILPPDGRVRPGAKPVLLQHGFLGSAMDFVINSPFVYPNVTTWDGRTAKERGVNETTMIGDNLAFSLAMTGRYDVWMGNCRGNRYSQGHVNLSVNTRDYWKFSFDQMAEYDLPAIIGLVLAKSNHTTLGYIGFSQGTSSMFALMSLKPEYARVVRPFLALAPIAFLSDVRTPDRMASVIEPLLRRFPGELIPSKRFFNGIEKRVCPRLEFLCSNIIFSGIGYDYKHFNRTRWAVYASYAPSSTSNWDLCHYGQLMNSGRFARFDYGRAGNMAKYNSPRVPDYPLQNIPSHAKIGWFQGKNDFLDDEKDGNKLKTILEANNVTLIENYWVPDRWNHFGFLYGFNSSMLVWRRLIQVLDEHVE